MSPCNDPYFLLGWPLSEQHIRNLDVAIFLDIVNVINVKLCMMVLLNELQLFRPFSVTLTIFQGHSRVRECELKILFSLLIKVKLVILSLIHI